MGNGLDSRDDPLSCTLVVLHAWDEKDLWVLLTDTPSAQTDATLYACRSWIEQGFLGLKTVGGPLGRQWHKTRRLDPVLMAHQWLVMAVATLLALAYGTRAE